MRKLNTKRMLRHIARTTPNRMTITIFPLDDDYYIQKDKYEANRAHFERMMYIKHHGSCRVRIWQDDGLRTMPHEYVYVFAAQPI